MMFENNRLQCLKVGKVNRKELYDSTVFSSVSFKLGVNYNFIISFCKDVRGWLLFFLTYPNRAFFCGFDSPLGLNQAAGRGDPELGDCGNPSEGG